MAEFIFNKYTTVVMDGSNQKVVDNVLNVIDVLTRERYGKATCRVFDDKHPTMMVIETKTSKRIYDMIAKVVEILYPGVCMFNVEM